MSLQKFVRDHNAICPSILCPYKDLSRHSPLNPPSLKFYFAFDTPDESP